jgi:hypothetical protein
VPNLKFGRSENLLDVLPKYELLGFYGLGLNGLKLCRTTTLDIMSKQQLSADRDILRIPKK